MLATAERLHPEGPFEPVEIIWHRPADPAACDGDCDYHPIACGEPGSSMPGGLRDVPDAPSEPGQRWCTACRPDMTPDGLPPAEATASELPATGTRAAATVPGAGGAVSPDHLPDRRTPPPVQPFADEMTAVDRDTGIPAWVRVTRPPLEHLTWRQPPARTDDGGTTA